MTHAKIEGKIILAGCLIVNDKKEILLLYRTDHHHYETPGGKVRLNECENTETPSIEDLTKTAERELYEELGKDVTVKKLKYVGYVDFLIPDGRSSRANKFLTKIISGVPKINEPEIFSKLDYLPINDLEHYPISPDLKLFLPKLRKCLETFL